MYRQKDSNPRKYIHIGAGVIPTVKPHNYLAEINYQDWVVSLEPKSD